MYDIEMKIDYNQVDGFNRYPSDIMAEYQQSVEEGLDISAHKEFFETVAAMKNGEEKTKLSDRIFEIVLNAEMCEAECNGAITVVHRSVVTNSIFSFVR